MSCDALRDELAAFLDGELTPEAGAAVLAHLEGCGACRDEKAVLERTRERVRSLPRVTAPAALLGGVVTRLAAAAGRGPCPLLDPAELSGFLDSHLDPAARAKVVAHLEACPSCRGDLVALDSVVSGVQNLPRIPAPEILAAIVRERIALLADAPAAREGRARRSERTAAAARAQAASAPRAPAAPRVPREPIQIPLPVRRFLTAASITILALVAVPFATVNGSARSPFVGSVDSFQVAQGRNGVGPQASRPAPPPALPKPLDRERTLALVADASLAPNENLAPAVERAYVALQNAGVTVTRTRDPAALVLDGEAPALRGVLASPPAGLSLEDGAALDVLLPLPLDRVYGRNGEVYAGTLVRRDSWGVELRTGELSIELPARSCVRIEPASQDRVEVGLVVRRKRAGSDE